ncbi:hypothetical protein HRbin04_00902 [archaeon HR04]|nr:hypothetical protein HRbin04_00902 [archaeon HR04]
MVLTLPLAYAATDTYTAVNSNKYEYGSRGTITSYKPAITNNVSSDHRDYMVYTVSGKKHTIGAGMNWYKTNAGSIIGWLMVYVHDPSNSSYQGVHYVYSGYTYTQNSVTVSASTCKATSSTSTTCNPAASGYCLIGSVVDPNTGYSLSKGHCYGTVDNTNFTTGIPGATSRAFSTYTPNQNTLTNLFDNLQFLWYDGSNQGWASFNGDSRAGVWIVESKCLSNNNNSNPTGWVIDFLDGARKFGTGPPTYTTDDCVIDAVNWEPGDEP